MRPAPPTPFTDEPVTDEQVQAIYDLVKYGPTAFNQQPLRVVLVRSAEGRERLVKHMADGNKAEDRDRPAGRDPGRRQRVPRGASRPVPALPAGEGHVLLRAPGPRAVRQLNGALQAAYFIIGVRAAGLAAGPMTGYDADGLEQGVLADGDHTVLAVVNIGKPGEDAWFPRSPRLAYDEVVTTV